MGSYMRIWNTEINRVSPRSKTWNLLQIVMILNFELPRDMCVIYQSSLWHSIVYRKIMAAIFLDLCKNSCETSVLPQLFQHNRFMSLTSSEKKPIHFFIKWSEIRDLLILYLQNRSLENAETHCIFANDTFIELKCH